MSAATSKLSADDKAAGKSAEHVPSKLTLFWRILSGKPLFKEKLSEWGKTAELAIVMVGTSVADERVFSIMNFVTEQRPSLTTNLEAVVRGAEQKLFTVTSFPLQQARQHFLSQAYAD